MKKRIILSVIALMCIIFFIICCAMQINTYYMSRAKTKSATMYVAKEIKNIHQNQLESFVRYNSIQKTSDIVQTLHGSYIDSKLQYIEENKVQNQVENITCENNVDQAEYVDFRCEEDVYITNENTHSFVGSYSITAYTATGNTMANGEYPYVGCAASCDFPLDTVITIEGIGTYVIKDVCPTSGVIDLYMSTYEECVNFGRQYANVYI